MRQFLRFVISLLLAGFLPSSLGAQPVPPQYAGLLNGKSGRQQIDIVDSLAFEVRKTDPALSVALLKSAIRLSIVHDIDTAEIQERMNLNRQYRFDGQNDSAMMQIDSSLAVAKEAGLGEWEGEVWSAKGVLQARLGLYDKATESFLTGIGIAKSLKDTATLAMLNKQWALVYFYTTDFNSAIERTHAALKFYTVVKDTLQIAACKDNIGLYYSNLQNWDSAYKYQLSALREFEVLGDTAKLMVCYNNLGSTLIKTRQYELAKMYLDKALRLAELHTNQYQTMTVLSSMGELFGALGDRTREQEVSLRVFDLATKQQNDLYLQISSHRLAGSYYAEKNFERSAFYYRITDSLRQIIYDSEKAKAADDAAEKYKAQEHQQQIELLEADNKARTAQNERDRLIKWAIISVVIILLIFSAFVVRNYYRKKRDNKLLHEQNEAIEEQKAIIEVKNEEITDSINYAVRIQNAVLPTEEKLNALFPDNFIYYRPRDIISGDFYWAAEGRNGMRFLAVADCTGHGVPGAMMSMLGSSILNRLIARKNIPGPGKILDALHDELLATLNTTRDSRQVNDGMDIALLMFDPEQKRVVIASADRPVFYTNENGLQVVAPDKISIGSSLPKTGPYSETVLPVGKGLNLYLFSDGITDQFGGSDRKKFMTKRLKELIASNTHLGSAERKELFTKTFDVWKAGMEQTDDMTLVNVNLS
jgi:serine phosphatase RsbU (regulator of sigma subunit)